jgi:hypothetical protein
MRYNISVEIIFSQHALESLEKRNIPKEFVRKAISSPNFEIKKENQRVIILKKIGNKFLKVVLVRKPTLTIVVTGHWLSVKRAERLKYEN